ncbi:conjugal transfer protein TraG N-terminal domain-containing protein [Campylobacter lari]|nr:conjugal transfer protein TraG N-terminal domain-containing protein [Campylobacter lari]
MKRFYILFLSALIFAPSLLFGATNIDDNHIIFTWGYGEVANDILQAIKGITSGADYMVKIVMAIAFFTFAIKKVMDERTSPIFEFGKMIFIMVIIWQCFLRAPNDAQHRYMIHDNVTGKDYIVSQVPLGIGLTFSFMSRMEDSITKAMEKFYSTPQSTNFSNAGFGFTLRSTMDLPDLELSQFSPRTQKNLDLFFRNCVIYGMELNEGRMDTNFRHSDNLYEDLFEIGKGSQFTLYFGEKDKGNIRSCTQAGALIKQDLGSLAPKIETIHARILGSKDENAYRASMQGVWEIFSGQATQARSQLMQAMLINASRDSLINTAKMVGLDPNAVATNTAVAEQNFMSSMLTQGMMAQTYLPLAKAYLTVLIIGLSWIMALLSIMFGDFRHIKMFFTLCIWIVLWTPILSIINYFNDLNLSKSVQVLLDGSLSFSMSNSLSFFKQISEQTNFINYLVMLTPLLAFAVAKASEQGFVSVASSLSQTLQGASRSAGSFTNQQALSTETKIASPLGEEVIAKHAGINSRLGAYNVDNHSFSVNSISGGGNTVTDVNTNSKVSYDNNGVNSANITGLDASSIKTMQSSASNDVSKAIGDTLKTGRTSQDIANMAFDHSSSHGINAQAQEVFKASATKAFDKMAQAGDTKASEISGALKAGANMVVVGSEFSVTEKDGTSRTYTLSDKEMEQWNKEFANNVSSTYSNDSSVRASLNNAFSTFTGKEFSQVHSAIDKYSSTESLSQNVNVNSIPKALNDYIKSGDNTEITNAWNTGNKNHAITMAMNDFQNWAVNNPQQLSKYFNAGEFDNPSNNIGEISNKNYHASGEVASFNNSNISKVDGSATKHADQYQNNVKTLKEGHQDQTGQSTTWGDSSGNTQKEVSSGLQNTEKDFKDGAVKRTGGNIVKGSKMVTDAFAEITK